MGWDGLEEKGKEKEREKVGWDCLAEKDFVL